MSWKYDLLIDLTAGSLGATASVYMYQPLDTLKVKMQMFPRVYPNLSTCFLSTLRNEGVVRGLYAGTVPSLLANVTEKSILLAGYGLNQKIVASQVGVDRVEDLSAFANGVSGFLAAFWSSLALCPTELVKCRLQASRELYIIRGENPRKLGPYKVTRDIIVKDGVLGLFKGLTATFAREMPGFFFFFFTYELSRELLKPPGKTKDDIGPLRTILSGGVAGVSFWTSIFPVDVVKSRLQVTGASSPVLAMMKDIYVKEGFMALYNGLGPTVIRTFPAIGMFFFTYEYYKKFMQTQCQYWSY